LHVAIRALLDASVSLSCPDLFLLCAGKIADDREIRVGLETLVRTGRARVIDRYVSDQEEELSFAATDVVLLPYLQHFGSSGVLSRAAAAGKMVIASDEGLIARRIRAHELGLLFSSGNHHELAARMREARVLSEADLEKYKNSGLRYAATCSRPVFRKALHDSLLS
jgi:glycosyltransferase involved in cell wall biosynthesis